MIKTHRTRDIPRRIRATLKDRTALEVGIGFLGPDLKLMGSLAVFIPSLMAGLPRLPIMVVLFIVDVGWNSSLGGSHPPSEFSGIFKV